MKSSQDIENEVARLVSSGIHIPPQPKIVFDLNCLLQSSAFDLRELAELIAQDPGLTAMLYKVTRSAAFSRVSQPETVDQILSIVGIQQVAALVQSYGLTAALKKDDKRSFEPFWNRAGNLATLASLICFDRVQHGCVLSVTPDQAYMIGIFHDCGIPILMQRFPDYFRTMGVGGADNWIDVRQEDLAFKVDHCSIGYLLARHWRLPDFVAEAILGHHDLSAIKDPKVITLVAILTFSIYLYSSEHALPDPEWINVAAVVLDELMIDPQDLRETRERIMEMYRAN